MSEEVSLARLIGREIPTAIALIVGLYFGNRLLKKRKEKKEREATNE